MNFDYKEYSISLVNHFRVSVLSNLSEENKILLLNIIENYAFITSETLVMDDYYFKHITVEQVKLYTKSLVEIIYSDCLVLFNGGYNNDSCSNFLQKKAYYLFETIKKSYKDGLDENSFIRAINKTNEEHDIKQIINECLDNTFFYNKEAEDTDKVENIDVNTDEYLDSLNQQLDELTNKITSKTDNPDLYYKRSLINFKLFEYDSALNDINKAIELFTKPEYYCQRGKVHQAFRKYHDAINDYTSAISLDGNCFEAFMERGYTREFIYDYELAISDYKKALDIQPYNEDVVFMLDCAEGSYETYKENEILISNLTDKIAKSPENYNLYQERGYYYNCQGKYDLASLDYDIVLKQEPNNQEAIDGKRIASEGIERGIKET